MTTSPGTLTPVQARILRDAARHTIVVTGKQRGSVNRLCTLGFVTCKTTHVPSVSANGRDEIAVEITRRGRERLWGKPPC